VASEVVEWIHQIGPAPEGRILRRWLRQQVPEYAFND
jgi:hypothetical protein